MNCLAFTLYNYGQLEEAERMQRGVLVLQKEVLGLRHPNTITIMSHLSVTLRDRGQLEEAERIEREVLVLRKEVTAVPEALPGDSA
jgi:hypothetical protein